MKRNIKQREIPTHDLRLGDVIMSPKLVSCGEINGVCRFLHEVRSSSARIKKSRKHKKFVVIDLETRKEIDWDMENVVYHDIQLKCLYNNGNYDQEGEEIWICSSPFPPNYYLDKVLLVGNMKRVITFLKCENFVKE